MLHDARRLDLIHHIDRDADPLRFLAQVAASGARGSRTRRPFSHMSCTLGGAYRFAKLGQDVRNEKAQDQIFTKVDLLQMYVDGVITDFNLIDISSKAAVQSFSNL